MRFIALVMMLQGHTVYQLLDSGIRNGESATIAFWLYLRGYTAPVFMTVSGMVFTYLLVLAVKKSGNLGLRLKNGLTRVLTLLFWGYLLRMPFEWLKGNMSQMRLDVGLSVDVLHLIAFGLLSIIVVFLACRPLLQRGCEHVAAIFFLLFLSAAQFSPLVSDWSFHRGVEPVFSVSGLGVVVEGNAEGKKGIFIREVIPGSEAAALGLVAGDVITRIGKQPIERIESLSHVEALQVYGKPSPIQVQRGDEFLELKWNYNRPLQALPNAWSFWLNRQPAPSGVASLFSIFPWAGYLMFGAGFGALLAGMSLRNSIPRRLDLIFFIIGASFIAWSEVASSFGRIWLGGGDSSILFLRIGGVMLLASVTVFASHWIKKLPSLVIQMSRNSLWLYIGHLFILYSIVPEIYWGKIGVLGTLLCVICMFLLMIAQTLLIEKKQQLGSWKNTIAFFAGFLRGRKTDPVA